MTAVAVICDSRSVSIKTPAALNDVIHARVSLTPVSNTKMTQQELFEKLAEKSGLTKKQAKALLSAQAEILKETVGAGGAVIIPGFGKLTVSTRLARTVTNPKTGVSKPSPEKRVVKYSPAKALKEAAAAGGANGEVWSLRLPIRSEPGAGQEAR